MPPPCTNSRRLAGCDGLPGSLTESRRLFNRAIGNFAGVNCPACPNPVKPCLKKAGLCGDKQYEIKATVRDGILCMTMKTEYRAGVTIGALIAASLALSGCMGPTYGTDKTSTAQSIDDLGKYRHDRLSPVRAPISSTSRVRQS
jgi:hypothetical protein